MKKFIFVLLLLLSIAVVLLFQFLDANKTQCETVKIWEFGEYKIVKKSCIGFAGPRYYPFQLYNKNKLIDEIPNMADTACTIKFKSNVQSTITFNLCDK